MNDFKYITPEIVTKLHTFILNESGGMDGFKNKESLNATLTFIKNDIYYESFIDKICYLIFSIACNHYFLDGNKRTAISSASLFLKINNYEYCVDRFIEDMEYLVVALVDHTIDRTILSQFIEFIINEDDYPEHLKLIQYKLMSK